MQYQVYKEDTREVVAWIDTETNESIFLKGYGLNQGEDLSAIEVEDDYMVLRVKFFDKDLYAEENALKKIGEKSDWIDLRARKETVLKAGESAIIPLGVAMQLPSGYEAHIVPRSSTFKKWGIIQTNHMGVIDTSYCGDNDEWGMPVLAMRDTVIQKGDRICQFRIVENQPSFEFDVVESLGNSDRGGFGSTGTN